MKINLPSGLDDGQNNPPSNTENDDREILSSGTQMRESTQRARQVAGGAVGKATLLAGRTAAKSILGPKLFILVAIIAVIVLIISTIMGAVNQASSAQAQLSKVTESACGNPSPDLWDLTGVTNPEDFIGELLGTQTCQQNPQGVGYTGEVYPPTTGYLTSEFPAPRSGGRGHGAIDIAGGCGAPVFAYAGGTIVRYEPGSESMGGQPGGGIVIEHTPDFYTLYWHMRGSEMPYKEGAIVSAGQQIGTQFSNGNSSGCHLHFEMSKSNPRITEADVFDPLPVLHADGFAYGRLFNFTPDLLPANPALGGPGGIGGGSVGAGASTDPKRYALEQVKARGWAEREFTECLVPLWEKESNWNPTAINPAFSRRNPATPEFQAYGIPQSGPGLKMASEGADWKTNPQTQIRWGLGYIEGRYGTPCAAWAHSQRKNWY